MYVMIKKLVKDNKKIIGNLFMSIGATVVFNVVIQFVMYPYFERNLGEEKYGLALSILSIIAILAGTLGNAANYSRMMASTRFVHTNGDYNILLLTLSPVCAIGGIFYLRYLGITSIVPTLLFVALVILTTLRNYSDVGFRIKSNFVRYMLFYVFVAAGYIIGLCVFKISGEWMWTLIIGEALGVLFAVLFDTIYRKKLLTPSKNFPLVLKSMSFLALSTLIDNLTLNADRLLLMVFSGGTAVAVYYAASLMGKIVAMLSVPINSILISYIVKYRGGLTPKFWLISTASVSSLGLVAFACCSFISPYVLRFLYPDLCELTLPYIVPAILGQIFYFISGMLLVIILKFKGEKKQFMLNAGYAAVFLVFVCVGTFLYDLDGFVYCSLIANALRFAAIIVWGFIPQKKNTEIIKK